MNYSNFNHIHDFYKTPSVPYQISFQEPATPVMNGLLDLHDYVFFFLIIIVSVVLMLLVQVVYTFTVTTRKPILFSFSEKDSFMFNVVDNIWIFLNFIFFFVYFFSILFFNIYRVLSLDFLKNSFKTNILNQVNNSIFVKLKSTQFLQLNKNIEYNKIEFVDQNVFSSFNYDYVHLLTSNVDFENLNLIHVPYNETFGENFDFSAVNMISSDIDFNEFVVYTNQNFIDNVDYYFFFDNNINFVSLDANLQLFDLDLNDDLVDNDFLEDELVDVILNNIVFHVFTSRLYLTLDFFYQIFHSISFFSTKSSNKDLDTILIETLNNVFLNNVLSSKALLLQRSLKIGYFNHSTKLEIIWTLIPIFIIGLIITPSFFFMYAIDEDMESILTVRVIGHQWFWSYVYAFPSYTFDLVNIPYEIDVINNSLNQLDLNLLPDRKYLSFDSYMLDNMHDGSPRLLATDSILILPKFSHINCIITSTDVIHSWAIPSFGVKVDAVPGRLNRADVFIEHEGMFFGQCSELCGVNHSFMPIHIQAVSLSDFLKFIFGV